MSVGEVKPLVFAVAIMAACVLTKAAINITETNRYLNRCCFKLRVFPKICKDGANDQIVIYCVCGGKLRERKKREIKIFLMI
jgi:hypothetical protein